MHIYEKTLRACITQIENAIRDCVDERRLLLLTKQRRALFGALSDFQILRFRRA